MRRLVMITAVALALGTGLSACEEEGPAEQLGEQIDEGAEETGEALEDAGEGLSDTAD